MHFPGSPSDALINTARGRIGQARLYRFGVQKNTHPILADKNLETCPESFRILLRKLLEAQDSDERRGVPEDHGQCKTGNGERICWTILLLEHGRPMQQAPGSVS